MPADHAEQALPVALLLKLALILRAEEQLADDQGAVTGLMFKVKGVEVLEVLAAVAWVLLDVREEDTEHVLAAKRVLGMELDQVAIVVWGGNALAF